MTRTLRMTAAVAFFVSAGLGAQAAAPAGTDCVVRAPVDGETGRAARREASALTPDRDAALRADGAVANMTAAGHPAASYCSPR